MNVLHYELTKLPPFIRRNEQDKRAKAGDVILIPATVDSIDDSGKFHLTLHITQARITSEAK